MSRSTDEILLFLIRNARPEMYVYPVSEDGRKVPSLIGRLEALLLRTSGATRFLCPDLALEEFLGEKVSFERHLRPIHTEGTLVFQVAEPGTFYDSDRYRELFDHSNGRVMDYKTRVSSLAFHIRGNDFLADYKRIHADAEALGLFKGLMPRKTRKKTPPKPSMG